jgi:hypothetical protein
MSIEQTLPERSASVRGVSAGEPCLPSPTSTMMEGVMPSRNHATPT